MEIEWAEPPAAHSDPEYAVFAEALKANPGRWAKWPKVYTNPSAAGAVRINVANNDKRAPVPFRTGKWEAVVRSKVLYVRYMGEE